MKKGQTIMVMGEPIKVLLVEDDAAHVAAIRRSLQTVRPDIMVEVVGTLAAFRQTAAERPPDIAIMDLNLPDGCSLEVLASPPEAGPFPVLIMTSYGNEQVAVEALKAGALDYVVKSPETFFGMPRTLERALREWHLLMECRQIEETLRKNEENFHRSFDDSPLGVRIATAKGETIYANRTILDLFGYDSMDEINRIPVKERYTPKSYAEFESRIKIRAQGDFGPSEYEISIVRKSGEIRHLHAFRKVIHWNGTKHFQVIYNDITGRKQAEEILKKKMDELQRFQSLTVGRELVMIELKKEVNELLKISGRKEKYRIVE
jgi:PAS domain S-box-containing protein